MTAPAGIGFHEPRVDSAQFRQVLGRFCSGVTIITGVADGGAPAGLTCQSFFSLSLDPPLVAFSVSRTSGTWPRIAPSKAFCVNVLSTAQQQLSRSFAARGTDKFAGQEWTPAPVTGSPALPGSLAWIDCVVEAVHPGGDHWLVIGRVRHLAACDYEADPLLFYRAAFRRPAVV
ncbi:flavin reductase family protein [Streptomyces sp. NBC_00328]|uniref:flavin reductase family protein n=1 Tax=Streptomyces sp. NBC_00328 TaxID=2903646 RepID=UPI002E2AE343|nr:flavin reductase family protein [Streptomyces sp. NBC_00328]